MGRYTTDDPETGLSVRKAVYGRTEQEAPAKLIDALAALEAGSLVVSRELTVGQYAEHWLAGLRKRPTTKARYRQALAHVIERIPADPRGAPPTLRIRPRFVLSRENHTGRVKTRLGVELTRPKNDRQAAGGCPVPGCQGF